MFDLDKAIDKTIAAGLRRLAERVKNPPVPEPEKSLDEIEAEAHARETECRRQILNESADRRR